ncbi:hypothetical protein [Streptacidiphilus cavernicola]|uniref:PknH-like extracellular domain-containing protein n=1 Tax=Streptacidiphilus cavernicola TaxID=3342716 RepID=A0ABV6VNP7_9ACTN
MTHFSRKPIAGALAVAAALLSLAGCGSSSPAASPGPAAQARTAPPAVVDKADWPAAVPQQGLAKGMVLPMEAYEESYPDSVVIQKALNKLTVACLSGYGFTYAPPEPGTAPPPDYDPSNMERRYGISDPAKAAVYGYHLAHGTPASPTMAPMSVDEQTALYGQPFHSATGTPAPAPTEVAGKAVPAGGCMQSAYDRLGGFVDTSVPDKLDAQSIETSQADPRVQAALARWSACMARSGYHFSVPDDAPNAGGTMAAPTAGAKEIKIAVADVHCKAQSALVSTWYQVEKAVQQHQVDQNLAALDKVKRQLADQVRVATAIAQ